MDEIYWADFRPAAVDIGGTMHDLKPPPYLMRRIIFNFYWVG